MKTALSDDRFINLPNGLGRSVPDGSTRSVTVIYADGVEKTVTIEYLVKDKLSSDERTALLIWIQLRGLIDHDLAVDSRPYDKKMLD